MPKAEAEERIRRVVEGIRRLVAQPYNGVDSKTHYIS